MASSGDRLPNGIGGSMHRGTLTGSAAALGLGVPGPNSSAAAASDAQLTLPKVLAFIQSEWRRFELDRNTWEIERAELESRVAVLEGERRGLENVKADLLKRIKLLEFALRQERMRTAQRALDAPPAAAAATAPTATDTPPRPTTAAAPATDSANAPVAPTQLLPPPGVTTLRERPSILSLKARKETTRSREVLKAYLKEVSSLVAPGSSAHAADSVDPAIPPAAGAPTTSARDEPPAAPPALRASTSLDMLLMPRARSDQPPAPRPVSIASDASESNSVIFLGQQDAPDRRRNAPGRRMRRESMSRMDGAEVQEMAVSAPPPVSTSQYAYRLRSMLRHHVDVVRMVDFHPSDPIMVSGSEDMTVKLWNLQRAKKDTEAFATFRGHLAPVLSVAFDMTGEKVFSGAADGTIKLWKVPSERTMYSPYDKSLRLGDFSGHTDAVWDLKTHPFHALLASCSADGAIHLWDTQLSTSTPLKHTLRSPAGSIPTSVSFLAADARHLWSSSTDGTVRQFDLETGQITCTIQPSVAGDAANRVVAHPLTNLLVSVHESGAVRFLDPVAGTCLHSAPGGTAGVAAVDLHPNGLTLAAGAHDGRVRLWDVGARAVVAEALPEPVARRRDEGVWTTRFHSFGWVAAAGADAVVRVYQPV
ncbi:hypothetical protein AMAG_08749 [Allomyces macrogynus ATCC 38327]|uniref:Striatin N-terminal domain-containing protein n=1 Tax=Allomyces macrogynus (strain ATCC 38327) TaxID=578462 RepID=A0A0L0SM61_ALLM3|nr:hypothetical protein AMAG_08749 [Allomyces macrogynus ATCC 38327]|eukprot:KNE63646.1 hypothetical protein AMAG_08749 [Allomyces macrogynus ATCC 38327]